MSIFAGLLLALVAVYLVIQPLLRAASGRTIEAPEPLFSDSDDEEDPARARQARALAALKEIDFDKATGKLSDEDYDRMKAAFTEEALDAMRAADAAEDADSVESLIASARSAAPVTRRFCLECGAPLSGSAKFCLQCGAPVGALIP